MGGDAAAFVIELDDGCGEARFDLLVEQRIRDAVVVVVNFHVIIHMDPAVLPLRQLETFARQRLERWAADVLEELAAAHAHFFHHPVIDHPELFPDGGIKFSEAEEGVVT